MPKQRTCKICGTKFIPNPNMFCPPTCNNFDCMVEYSNRHLKKSKLKEKQKQNKAVKEFRENDKGWLLKLAQQTFNKFIRLRDKDLPCISCGTTNDIQYHCGHYKPAGGYSYLRFDERNCHKQCVKCNNFLSGNLAEYRIALIKKIGIKEVEKLEQPNQLKTWTVEELKEIINTYKDKTKQLNFNNN